MVMIWLFVIFAHDAKGFLPSNVNSPNCIYIVGGGGYLSYVPNIGGGVSPVREKVRSSDSGLCPLNSSIYIPYQKPFGKTQNLENQGDP